MGMCKDGVKWGKTLAEKQRGRLQAKRAWNVLHNRVGEPEVVTPSSHSWWEQHSTDKHPPSEPLIRYFYSKYSKDSDFTSLNRKQWTQSSTLTVNKTQDPAHWPPDNELRRGCFHFPGQSEGGSRREQGLISHLGAVNNESLLLCNGEQQKNPPCIVWAAAQWGNVRHLKAAWTRLPCFWTHQSDRKRQDIARFLITSAQLDVFHYTDHIYEEKKLGLGLLWG